MLADYQAQHLGDSRGALICKIEFLDGCIFEGGLVGGEGLFEGGLFGGGGLFEGAYSEVRAYSRICGIFTQRQVMESYRIGFVQLYDTGEWSGVEWSGVE